MSDEAQHIDNLGVDGFAQCMKAKLRRKRREGYGGWDSACSVEYLRTQLREHFVRGLDDRSNLVDIANFCMMLHHRMQLVILAGERHA